MHKMAGILTVLVALAGCGEDEGPQFMEPSVPKVPTANYAGLSEEQADFLPDRTAHVSPARGGFTIPTTPISQTCSILDGRVTTPSFSSYWDSCYEAPMWTIEATVEGILRDVGVFWNSSFVPCDCSDIDPDCQQNAFASSAAPGFIWYDDLLIELLAESDSLVPVAYVMAHEAAHHIQYAHGYRFSHTIEAELSADCMAGYFFGYLSCTGQIDGIDVSASLGQICAAGDLPGTPWWDDDAHGSCLDRMTAAMSGVSGYALRIPPKDWCIYDVD